MKVISKKFLRCIFFFYCSSSERDRCNIPLFWANFQNSWLLIASIANERFIWYWIELMQSLYEETDQKWDWIKYELEICETIEKNIILIGRVLYWVKKSRFFYFFSGSLIALFITNWSSKKYIILIITKTVHNRKLYTSVSVNPA